MFEYQLDEKLENDKHEMYVTSVNSEGKILAKSPPFYFVKTSEGVEYTPEIVSNETELTVNDTKKTAVTFMLLVMLSVTIGTIVWYGFIKSENKRESLGSIAIQKEN